jgi:hypothetical protein
MNSGEPDADPRAQPAEGRARRLLLVGLITIGIALRAWHWEFARSLWIDEARLALNVLGRSFRQLTEPLWFDQSAPILFLWASKLTAYAAGSSERVLRLIPMLSGMLAIPLAYRLGRSVLRVEGALLLTAIIAVSPLAIYYSNELKPYSTDLVLAMGLTLVVMRTATSESERWWSAALLLGVIAPWMSASMFFVLPGCVVAIWLGGRRRAAIQAGLLWGCSAAAVWFLTYSSLPSNAYLNRYWSFRFWGGGAQWGDRVWSSLVEVVSGVLSGAAPAPDRIGGWASVATASALILIAVGMLSIVRKSRALAAVLFIPIGLLVVAALFGAYPFSLRLLLFAIPLILVLALAGVEKCLASLGSGILQRSVWLMIGLGVVGPLLTKALRNATYPETWAPIRTLVGALQATSERGQPVYVAASVLPIWVYYTMDWSRTDQARLEAAAEAGSSGGYALENGGRNDGSRQLVPAAVGASGTSELWGSATGLEWIAGFGFTYSEPHEQWAVQEAERIVAIARPRVWLVSSQVFGAEKSLRRAVEEAGLCKALHIGDERASAILYHRDRCSTSDPR